VPATPRLLRAILLGSVAAAVIAPAVTASAAPSQSSLQQQIDQKNVAFEKIVEQYNGATVRLQQTQAQSDKLNAQMAPLQSKMDAAYANVGKIAAQAYQTGNVSPMEALLSGGSTDSLIDALTSLDHLAKQQQADIDGYTKAKRQYDGQRKQLDQLLAQQRTDQQNLAAQKAKIQGDLAGLMALRQKAYGRAQDPPTTGAGPSGGSHPAPPSVNGRAGIAVRFAYAQLGKPYVFAAAGPGSYDCSGLVMAAWRAAGVTLYHQAAVQWNETSRVSRAALMPGDLVFYLGLDHVAIYVGGGRVIHAPHPGTSVQLASIDMMAPYGYGRPH